MVFQLRVVSYAHIHGSEEHKAAKEFDRHILADAALECWQGEEGRRGRPRRSGHMGVKFSHAFGAHTVVFSTSPKQN
jgi:hypothetical protein